MQKQTSSEQQDKTPFTTAQEQKKHDNKQN
jgi:hypothetical protein